MAKCRVTPIVYVQLFRAGSEPYFGPLSDYGFSWYSRLNQEWNAGALQYNSTVGVSGVPLFVPTIEYIGVERIRTGMRSRDHEVPIGLCLRPFVVPSDMGTWTEMTGSTPYANFSQVRSFRQPPVLRLVQKFGGVDDSDNTLLAPWGAESDDLHPANASFSFSILPTASTPAYDPSFGGVAYVQIAWSGGKWAIRFYDEGPPTLLRHNGTQLMPVMELQAPSNADYGGDEPDEIVGIVRCQRGALCISMDNGATYDVWWEPNGTAVSVPAGKYQFTGQGRAASLGIHQVVYLDSTYTSPRMPTDRSRSIAPTVRRTRGRNYTNTGYVAASIGPTSNATYLQYRVTLTAGIVTSTVFDYHFSPEVYTVEIGYPTTPSMWIPIHDSGNTFERRIKRLQISKAFDLADSSCSFTARYEVAEGGPIIPSGLAERLIRVYGGWIYSDGSNDVAQMFTGYITSVKTRQINSVVVEMDVEAQNTSLRPKRFDWRDGNCVPYDGLSPNQALLKWANSMGLDTTFVNYDYSGRGDFVCIPDLFPEDPSALPNSGEERWGFLNDLIKKSRLELGIADNGAYSLIPNDLYRPSPYLWDADPDEDAGEGPITDMDYEQMVLDTFTGLQVRGRTMWNARIGAWIRDIDAEENIISSRFRPWPEWHVETIEEPTSLGWLGLTAQSLAYQKLTPRFDRNWKGYLANTLSRRDAVWVTGLTDGGGSRNLIGVHEITHVFDRDDTMQAYTQVRGRRLI